MLSHSHLTWLHRATKPIGYLDIKPRGCKEAVQ
jgi:hypothetical protein